MVTTQQHTVKFQGQEFVLIHENTGNNMVLLTLAQKDNDCTIPNILKVSVFYYESLGYCEVKFNKVILSHTEISKIIDFYDLAEDEYRRLRYKFESSSEEESA